jgi:flagellar basal-body rod protein FlgC
MDLTSAMTIAAAGMKVQSARLRVTAENLANAESTARVPGGDPFRRKTVVFASRRDREAGVELVDVRRYGVDPTDFELRHEPGHPGADAKGYVKYPNMNHWSSSRTCARRNAPTRRTSTRCSSPAR